MGEEQEEQGEESEEGEVVPPPKKKERMVYEDCELGMAKKDGKCAIKGCKRRSRHGCKAPMASAFAFQNAWICISRGVGSSMWPRAHSASGRRSCGRTDVFALNTRV